MAWWSPADVVAQVAAVVLLPVVISRVWMLRWPLSWATVSGRVRGVLWRLRVRRRWREVATRCGLADERIRDRHRVTGEHPGRRRRPKPLVPAIRCRASTWPHVTATVWPLTGQTVESFEKAGEAIRIGR